MTKNTPCDKHAVLELADFIEEASLNFDMDAWYDTKDPCKTVACIGGHASVLFGIGSGPRSTGARQNLGISIEASEILYFNPEHAEGDYLGLHQITRAMAVATLRRLA